MEENIRLAEVATYQVRSLVEWAKEKTVSGHDPVHIEAILTRALDAAVYLDMKLKTIYKEMPE